MIQEFQKFIDVEILSPDKVYVDKRDFVQIKWYSLFDDIIMYKANTNMKNNDS